VSGPDERDSIGCEPNAPAGQQANWIPTMGKEPYRWLRLYGPEEAFWTKRF
jgi:hypothetical protein